ncbi:hypothetical protein EMIHUDRAFT_236972 [Emiliania huxleyi CCMP1516]|uniref:Photolyase/cryptochrome alpha/beta domain-containing protein n=2 Tax=Emiliania huxleyi TaxID=2903 RepID=A0A0D3IGQ6_EMIH1|nr:hypothetical protein EMIHUDRAFT_215644 [Emiliania huxleyi CCMP1516]XP_005778602.1 hypothetical protein EMIHUDRAFT_236972 [Emiliania huxleyi CCMP1516]EOD10441.1 hypothetical protein EMIHUDRAFT_215644 [Emiliania huxleyi CCMP1516]EOD26173.1 hypothetical protein EMIHUDRAFT_236972 [Emiliania huxleyi CCMP1516]|eukprot:XP_005762870.1 hypothetical protein EMIHUDRAFT_215644 [Emiliania huxleyi CCMP1516]
MNVVWLKRDVRLHDHEPLALSPPLCQSRCFSSTVRTIASGDGGGLTLRLGDAVDVLAALHALLPIKRLLSHREVGNAFSRARNARVSEWADAHGVSWTQCAQDGVSDVRHSELGSGLKNPALRTLVY